MCAPSRSYRRRLCVCMHIAVRECFNSVSDNCRAPSLTRAGTQTEFLGGDVAVAGEENMK